MNTEDYQKAIRNEVMDACTGHGKYNGVDPHATTWARGGYRNDVATLCDRCRALIEALQNLPVPEPEAEWEYGYISPWRDDNYMCTTPRKPDDWYGQERPIYRRRCAVPPGEWEVYDGPVTMEHDSRPWLFPGKDPDTFPADHRRAHDEGGMEFRPRRGYEQDIEAYGFHYAVCGRTQEHFPHSALDGTGYCNGVLREEKR